MVKGKNGKKSGKEKILRVVRSDDRDNNLNIGDVVQSEFFVKACKGYGGGDTRNTYRVDATIMPDHYIEGIRRGSGPEYLSIDKSRKDATYVVIDKAHSEAATGGMSGHEEWPGYSIA